VLESFTRKGCHPVRAVRRAQALLALATGIGHWHRPLASATGIGHWHRPLASATGIGQQAAGQAAGLSRQTVSQLRRRY
jgi:hypothetical protein